MADHELAQPDRRLLGVMARLAGVDRVWVTDETLQGESRSTFTVAAGGEEFVVKLVPAAGQAIDNQLRLVRMVRDQRQRGFPAPEYVSVGESSDFYGSEGWGSSPSDAPYRTGRSRSVPQALLQDVHRPGDHEDSDD